MRTILNEVVTIKIINENFNIEVKILRQQHEFLCKKKDFYILEEWMDLVSNGVFFFASDHALL